jgi:hypothetical protein
MPRAMSTTRSTRSASSRRDERGTGLIGGIAGIVAFLGFMLFAVQVAYDLYATSGVTSAAFDAVRVVAGANAADDPAARDAAEAGARKVLGKYGDAVVFAWSVDDDVVSLHVQARNVSFLPSVLRRPLGLDVVDRTVRARVERLR